MRERGKKTGAYTHTHLIKMANLHLMSMLLKIDWMMADAVHTTVSLVVSHSCLLTTLTLIDTAWMQKTCTLPHMHVENTVFPNILSL